MLHSRGATSNQSNHIVALTEISIHTPLGGSDHAVDRGEGLALAISIHAPLTGGDDGVLGNGVCILISIHASLTGGDGGLGDRGPGWEISIHASLTGGDSKNRQNIARSCIQINTNYKRLQEVQEAFFFTELFYKTEKINRALPVRTFWENSGCSGFALEDHGVLGQVGLFAAEVVDFVFVAFSQIIKAEAVLFRVHQLAELMLEAAALGGVQQALEDGVLDALAVVDALLGDLPQAFAAGGVLGVDVVGDQN